MRICLVIIIGFLSLQLSAQKNVIDNQGLKQGVWEKTYPDGKLKYTGTFKDDKPVGVFKYYYPEGKIKTELAYRAEKGKAMATHYYQTGVKQSEGLYKNQERDSIWLIYAENGKLIAKESYRNGKKEGLSISYFDDGKPSLKANFKNGLKDGPYSTYFENGQLQSEMSFMDNLANGPYKVYDQKGNPVLIGEYSSGNEVGTWEIYEKGGLLRQKLLKLISGKDSIVPVNGEFVKEFPNGMPEEIANYKEGFLHGVYEKYYDNGVWVDKEKVDPRSQTTDQYREMQGHTVAIRCRYVYGKLHGKCEHYFADGKIKKVEEYDMGKKLK